MTTYLMPNPKQQFFAIAGIPLVGGKIYTYAAGTTTPKPTYTDAAGQQPQPNPIVLNARGEPANPIFWSGNYRVELRDALGNLIYSVDDYRDPINVFSDTTGANLINYGAQTLADIFSNSTAKVVKSIAELKLIDFTLFSCALVLGYYAAGDGGGGLYFKTTTPAHAADGGTVIAASDKVFWQLSQVGTVSVRQFGAKGDGVSDDTAIISTAIAATTGVLYFPPGTYVISGGNHIALERSNITLRGAGMGVTILKRVGAATSGVIEMQSTTVKDKIVIEDMTIDANSINSGVVGQYVTNFAMRRCHVSNNPYWGIFIGIFAGTTPTIVNSNLTFEDCLFTGNQSTLESLLVFNSQHVNISGCFFEDSTQAVVSPALGLFQNLLFVTVTNCHFRDVRWGIYYSLSTNDIRISGCSFTRGQWGILGADSTDNGTFGYLNVRGLSITDCHFLNCTAGIQFGAVEGATMNNCIFQNIVQAAVVINNGNLPANLQSVDFNIDNCYFLDNNFGGAAPNAAITFSGTGGQINAKFSGCTFADNQATPTQRTPVLFIGAYSWNTVTFFGCNLQTYGGGKSIDVSGGATLANVRLYGCNNLTTLPTGTTVL